MLKKLFGRNKNVPKKTYSPVKPIFPGENFTFGQIEIEEGIGFVSVNQAYENYPNKKSFPWCDQLLLEFKYKNENVHPTDQEETKMFFYEISSIRGVNFNLDEDLE